MVTRVGHPQCHRPGLVHAVAVALSSLLPLSASAATYAPWLTQIGISDAVEQEANWGRGLILGDVDTGIIASNPAFAAGQVSSAHSACAAVTFRCANGFVDDNGHGTATAAIAASSTLSPLSGSYGGYSVVRGEVLGAAPDANIVAQKVLNASGSGYSADVANGIVAAATAGASVINLSLTFGNTADVVSAINYAASKGAYIVWAGGNSAQALLGGASTSGLSASAISHLILVGSVSAGNTRSSFSNTPGSGVLLSTTGSKTAYASRWIMAPGENILAPGIQFGASSYAWWSGTSMSTPLVSGSLLLLEGCWPILKTNGSAANLLLATATDLGPAGVDSTYGNGLSNVAKAFQPVGALAIVEANGKSVALSSLSGTLIAGGALGSLSSVKALLANYTVFDSYQRNFSVNLSGLIQTSTAVATVNALPRYANSGPAVMKFEDGSELSYLTPAAGDAPGPHPGYAMLNDKWGNTLALGYGLPVQSSFARALYGTDSLARQYQDLSAARPAGFAEGGGLFAYGADFGKNTRLALSWSNTPSTAPVAGLASSSVDIPSASNMTVGLSHYFGSGVYAGVSVGMLDESNGLLGSSYGSGSLNMGQSNKTLSLDLTLGVKLNVDNSLLLEADQASTRANSAALIQTGTLSSQSFGASLVTRNLERDDDRLCFSLVQPMRVNAGQIGLLMPSVNPSTGMPSFATQWTSAVPTGREIDYKLAYEAPLSRNRSLALEGGYARDVYHQSGVNQFHGGVSWTAGF